MPELPRRTVLAGAGWAAAGFGAAALTGCTPDEPGGAAGTSIDGRLFLAGEATEREHFGTVHGAYRSGVRAARQGLEA